MRENGEPTEVLRFAPSPNGWLHLGHACSALFAYETAKELKGRFLLRIEDIDVGRCRPNTKRRSMKIWPGSASTGNGPCAASRNISPTTKRH